jgi:hypothetical protein
MSLEGTAAMSGTRSIPDVLPARRKSVRIAQIIRSHKGSVEGNSQNPWRLSRHADFRRGRETIQLHGIVVEIIFSYEAVPQCVAFITLVR